MLSLIYQLCRAESIRKCICTSSQSLFNERNSLSMYSNLFYPRLQADRWDPHPLSMKARCGIENVQGLFRKKPKLRVAITIIWDYFCTL
jgi:hypothetical protein